MTTILWVMAIFAALVIGVLVGYAIGRIDRVPVRTEDDLEIMGAKMRRGETIK